MSTILITGCSQGIGFYLAVALGKELHTICATMRDPEGKNKENANSLRQIARESSIKLEVFDLDITKSESIEHASQEIIKKYGKIDVLINNAGVLAFGPIESFGIQAARNLFEVNFFGALNLTNRLLSLSSDLDINEYFFISSILGRLSLPYFGLYSASKFALEGLVESYNHETPINKHFTLLELDSFQTKILDNRILPDLKESLENYPLFEKKCADFEQSFNSFSKNDFSQIKNAISNQLLLPISERKLRIPIGVHSIKFLKQINSASEQAADLFL